MKWLKRQHSWYWKNKRKTPRWLRLFSALGVMAAFLTTGYNFLDKESARILGFFFLTWGFTFWAWTIRQWFKEKP